MTKAEGCASLDEINICLFKCTNPEPWQLPVSLKTTVKQFGISGSANESQGTASRGHYSQVHIPRQKTSWDDTDAKGTNEVEEQASQPGAT